MEKHIKYPLYNHYTRVSTINELLDFCKDKYGEKIAFSFIENKSKFEITYNRFVREVDSIRAYLHKTGIRNVHVGLLGENSYLWIATYFAIVCGKNTIVPIDKDLHEKEIENLLIRSDCSILFYDKKRSSIVEKIKRNISRKVDFILIDDISSMKVNGEKLLEQGYVEHMCSVDRNDIASIVFTSGTTGNSKGVVLTHYNFCSSMYGACCNVFLDGPSLLILPLHHTFGLVAGVFSVMFYGHTVCINQSLKRLSQDFLNFSPEHMFAVPLVVETMYKNIWMTAKKQGKEERLRKVIRMSDFLLLCHIDLRKVIFKSIHSTFGGNFKLIVSGGAPIDEKYISAFRSFGITVLNGYGITECGPIVAVNRNLSPVKGSVGSLLCCNQVKISASGEILVKGDNVMQGYYFDECENSKSFTEDGWFKTGDIGKLEDDILYVTGRIKNLIILSNGENISAESIENMVYTIPYVKEAIAYGEDNKIVVEVFLDETVSNPEERINDDINLLNCKLAQNCNIGKLILRSEEFPKTSSKKIKRNYRGDTQC